MSHTTKLGILGAGQLGKMLVQQTTKWDLKTTLLDKSETFPAAQLATHFVTGDFTEQTDVLKIEPFCDTVTIEIEKVNLDGLRSLRNKGLTVHPSPESLEIISDKGKQKEFYTEHNFPTSPYELIDTESELKDKIKSGELKIPFVLKSRRGGYDGRGVQIIKSIEELDNLIAAPYLLEEMIDIKKEISVIAVRNESDEIRSFPSVEMVFDPQANLVDYLFCPAEIDSTHEVAARQMAEKLIKTFNICGLLAVEMFITQDDELLINEVAPRPHNSGHHTIEACNYSQFEMHLRGVLNWPLPEIVLQTPAAMLNLLGTGREGKAQLIGLEKVLSLPGVYVHIYGKEMSRPHRKMGHVTVLGQDKAEIDKKIDLVRSHLSIEGRK